jgi:hypothetical protein
MVVLVDEMRYADDHLAVSQNHGIINTQTCKTTTGRGELKIKKTRQIPNQHHLAFGMGDVLLEAAAQ